MALVLLRDENEGRDKHVESTLFPRLDEGSIPSSSTNKNRHRMMPIFICGALHFLLQSCFARHPEGCWHHVCDAFFICGAIHSLYQRASHGTQKGAGITFMIPIFLLSDRNIILQLRLNEPRG